MMRPSKWPSARNDARSLAHPPFAHLRSRLHLLQADASDLSPFTWISSAFLLAFLVGSTAYFGFVLEVPVPFALAVAAFWAAAWSPGMRERPRLRSFLLICGLLPVLLCLGLAVSHTLQAFDHPLQDANLQAIDRWLGFDWLAFQRAAYAQHVIFSALQWAYAAFLPQIIAVPLILCLLGQVRRADVVLGAGVLAQILVFAVGAVLPAMGAASLVGNADLHLLFSGGATPLSTLAALRDGSLRRVLMDGSGGLVTCPSFHCAIAVISTYGLWSIKPLRWPACALNTAMVVSAVTHGAHYLTDVLAGLSVGVLAMAAATSMASLARVNSCRFRETP